MKRGYLFWSLVFFATFLCVVYSVGYYHPDEHWQILEFAIYWNGQTPAESLPWEFHQKMRPSLQPFIAFIFLKLSNFLYGEYNPFFWTFLLRALSAIFSIYTVHIFSKNFQTEISNQNLHKYFWILSFFTWFLIFLHVRFSSEAWSAHAWLLGITYLYHSNKENFPLNYFIAGIWLGLAFVFRYQLGFAILGVILWIFFIQKENPLKKFFALAMGGLLIFLLSTILDSLFYKEWVLAPYHYFYQNLILKKAALFGKEPWYFYFLQMLNSPTSFLNVVYFLSSLYFIIKFPKHLITWTILPFILIHLFINHKEVRFLFPVFVFLPFLLIKTLDRLLIFSKSSFIILKIWLILHLPFSLKTIFSYLQPQVIMYQLAWKYKHENVILLFRKNQHDKECVANNNYNPQSQCLKHNVYLKSNMKSWYYCTNDSIVVFQPYHVALIEYNDFRDKKIFPMNIVECIRFILNG